MEEKVRYQRVQNAFYRKAILGWHSLSCLCDGCLDADMAISVYGYTQHNSWLFNLKGLTP